MSYKPHALAALLLLPASGCVTHGPLNVSMGPAPCPAFSPCVPSHSPTPCEQGRESLRYVPPAVQLERPLDAAPDATPVLPASPTPEGPDLAPPVNPTPTSKWAPVRKARSA